MDRLAAIREQFPITQECFINPAGNQQTITYLDHGASTHPPRVVLDTFSDFLERYYANIHRGNHYLSQKASKLYDDVSEIILDFVKADHQKNRVILTANTTMALDMASFLMQKEDGATLVSNMEHHSNDLPHRKRGPVLRIGLLPDGSLDYDDLESKLKNNVVKLVAITGASNVTGYLPDIHRIARLAHAYGARILVDGAQLLAHTAIDVRPNEDDSHIDFFAAAGHKAYAPFGAAFLIAPVDVLDNTEPYIPGGGTVKFVTENDVVWADGVDRHTGGTPNIAGVIALGAGIRWLKEIGLDWIRKHELELLISVEQRLRSIPGVEVLGNISPERKLGVLSFNISGLHHDSVSTILNNEYGIATRNGCFCAHPYLSFLLGCVDAEAIRQKVLANDKDVVLPGAVRATIGIYNNAEDLDKLINAVRELASGVGVDREKELLRVRESACNEVA